jgi:hypothetical protein
VEDAAELKSVLLRFAQRMLQVLTNDNRARAIHRIVVAEAGRSDVGELFYQSGPSECVTALTKLLKASMNHGLLRRADPQVAALQLLALITAEINARHYQRDPAPVTLPAIRKLASRAVEMFLAGAAKH